VSAARCIRLLKRTHESEAAKQVKSEPKHGASTSSSTTPLHTAHVSMWIQIRIHMHGDAWAPGDRWSFWLNR
jgi:hypothetical protein